MIRYSLLLLFPIAIMACGDKDADDSTADDSSADDSSADDSSADDSSADDSSPTDELGLTGSYTDNWGGTHEINSTTWTMGTSVFHISQYDNAAMWVVAQNDAANTYNPNLWSRMDWTKSGDDLYFCQTAYDAADESAALATPAADGSNLASGCGGFGWSQLFPN